MTLYYFHLRTADGLERDEIGITRLPAPSRSGMRPISS